MKKLIFLFLVTASCLLLASCQDSVTGKTPEEHSSQLSDPVSAQPPEECSYEVKDPDFAVPYHFADCTAFLTYPSYDSEKSENGTTKYFSSGNLVLERTYDDSERISTEKIYSNDGKALRTEAIYEYDSETSFSVNYYEDGEMSECFKFNYSADGQIESVFRRFDINKPETYLNVEAYEYNPDGTVKQYISSDQISDAILNAIFGSLSQSDINVDDILSGLLGELAGSI